MTAWKTINNIKQNNIYNRFKIEITQLAIIIFNFQLQRIDKITILADLKHQSI